MTGFMRGFCRILVGLTFILSGVFKLMDPVGTGLIVDEYLNFMHLDFLKNFDVALGIALSTVEVLTGLCVMTAIRMRIFSWVALAMMTFFTLLTVYLVIYNPISDCGCFGEVVHLTNKETLIKNILPLICSIYMVIHRKRYPQLAPAPVEWTIVGLYLFCALWAGISSVTGLPKSDATVYKVGTDLKMLSEGPTDFNTVFIYEKDGVRQEFAIDDLPDSSWTYVDSRTDMPEGATARFAQVDLSLRDVQDEYHTELLYEDGPMMAAVVWDTRKMKPSDWNRIRALNATAQKSAVPTYLFAVDDNVPGDLSDKLLISDRKALMTLLRSNGGAVLFNSGSIIRKWAAGEINRNTVNDTLAEDYDITMLRNALHNKAMLRANVISGFLVVLIVRYILYVIIHKKKKKKPQEAAAA